MVDTVERRWTTRGTHTPAEGHQEQGDSLTPRTCGYSSDGRAAAFQAAGRRFDPGYPLGVSGAAGPASHNAPLGGFRVKAPRAHYSPVAQWQSPRLLIGRFPGSSPGRRAPPLRWINAADSSVAQWIRAMVSYAVRPRFESWSGNRVVRGFYRCTGQCASHADGRRVCRRYPGSPRFSSCRDRKLRSSVVERLPDAEDVAGSTPAATTGKRLTRYVTLPRMSP